jgi:hypothetical protein
LRRPVFPGLSIFTILGLVGTAALLLVTAGGAAAQPAWNGSGAATLSSTPSPDGPCTGSGTSQLALSGPSSSLNGTLTLDFTSYTSWCAGSFSTGPVQDPVKGYLSGDELVLSDSFGDSISATLSGDSLSLSLTEPAPTPPSGGSCAAYCHTVINAEMTGAGAISGAGGSGGLSLNFGDDTKVIAAVGLGFGLAGVGLSAASLTGRGPRKPGGAPPSREPAEEAPEGIPREDRWARPRA